jgi:hypothetical protein
MSVTAQPWEVFERVGAEVLAFEVHDHRVSPEQVRALRDALRALYGAQRLAYVLTYGEDAPEDRIRFDTRPIDEAWARDPYAVAASGDWGRPGSDLRSLQSTLGGLLYNTVSNGGTECLPVKWASYWEGVRFRILGRLAGVTV